MTLIAISGFDGSGKSTQIELLRESLAKDGGRVEVRWFRPGYSETAKRLKEALGLAQSSQRSGSGGGVQRDRAMGRRFVRTAWLIFAAIDAIVEFGVVARLRRARGALIYDRWVFDAVTDLRLNFPQEAQFVAVIARALHVAAAKPDISLVLMVSPEVAAERLSLKDDPHPEAPHTVPRRRAEYLKEAEQRPRDVVDGDRSIEAVQAEIRDRVSRLGD